MSYSKILSRHNELIKHLHALAMERSERHAHGQFIIEGRRFVEDALKSGAQLTQLILAEEVAQSVEMTALLASCPPDLPIYYAPMSLLAKIAQTKSPQGVVAAARMGSWNLPTLLQGGRGLWLVMDEVSDPGNMGTMVRTADAAGFDGVILSPDSVDLYNPKCLRSTMGSIFHIPCLMPGSFEEALVQLKAANVRLMATHLKGKVTPYTVNLAANAAIIVGNEAHGISHLSQQLADTLIKIPMPGQAESLNAGTAANILMFESVRQRLSPSTN